MRYYPIFLDLRGKRCLIVGAGEVGKRKLTALLPCNPEEILVLDTVEPDAELNALLSEHPAITFAQRNFMPQDIQNKALAFACTGNRSVNASIEQSCKAAQILCNIVDDPTAGDFIVPAHFESGDILVALSTGGHSPALAKRIRQELQQQFGNRYAALSSLLGKLRPLVLAMGNETRQNTRLFRALVNSQLVDALEARDMTQARALLTEILPAQLHQNIGEMLDEHA